MLICLRNFQRTLELGEENNKLHEKCLLITFWRRQVRKSVLAHLVAVIMVFLNCCRKKTNLLICIRNFQRTVELDEENNELHEKCLLITFWKRRVRKCMIAYFVAVILYFLKLFRTLFLKFFISIRNFKKTVHLWAKISHFCRNWTKFSQILGANIHVFGSKIN